MAKFRLPDVPPLLNKPLVSFNENYDDTEVENEKIADSVDEEEDSDDYVSTELPDDYSQYDEDDEDISDLSNSERPVDPQVIERYGYTLKILANSFLSGFGAYIKPGWVLSSFCLFDTSITKYHKVTVETWDTPQIASNTGQTRPVTDILIHPKYDEDACNYDVVLLKLANPLQLGKGISLVPLAAGPKPPDNTQCVVPAAFDRNIMLTNVVLSPIIECRDHYQYGSVEDCKDDTNLICIQMSQRLFGAPVICEERLIGVLPANQDSIQNLTIVQYLESYNQWIEETTDTRAKLRSNISLFKPVRAMYILVVIMTALLV